MHPLQQSQRFKAMAGEQRGFVTARRRAFFVNEQIQMPCLATVRYLFR
ncbi:hypothetical protein SAMN05216525_1397 [Bradyrhizobium sp. Gha]|nr:hypothetical protein SAMN05216525_1397 [Bradyrhizobium sp. Gha]